MANLSIEKVYDRYTKTYSYLVTNVDEGTQIGSYLDPAIAANVVAAGNDSPEALAAARQADINSTGGEKRVPVPPISTSTASSPSGPRSGNNVTYVSTDDPESQAIIAQLRAQNAASTPKTVFQKVADPAYAGGFRYEAVPADQTKSSATNVTDTPATNSSIVPADQTKSSATNVTDTPASTGSTYTITPPPAVTAADTPIPNYTVIQNADTGLYDVVDPATGKVVAGNLPDEATAQETAGLQQSLVSSPSVSASSVDQSAAPIPTYTVIQNADTGLWDVVDPATGTVVSGNLPDEATANEVLGLQQSLVSSPPVPQPQPPGQDPYAHGAPYDDEGNLNPGWTLDENNNPVYVGGDFVEPATLASAEQSRIAAQVKQAQKQQTIIDQQRQLNNQDWRLRISLAPNSNYLYNATNPGILSYLSPTNGVIFPYTPQISTSYRANYNSYDLTHSNYRGYFYQNSYTDAITVNATFTAQNTYEANYLLAVIHFFRSVTKMFYGQSQNVGSPPPICYLNGLGTYQFNKHPVLISQFNYTLPADVDYIRAGSSNNLQLNQNALRAKTNTLNPQLASVSRLATSVSSLYNTLFPTPPGAKPLVPEPTAPNTNNPTYVPTKIDIVLTLLPVQSRTQVSQQFSLENFASGQLLKGGFW